MILITGTKLEAVLSGVIATNQPVVHVDYIDWAPTGAPTNPLTFRTQLNSNTDVTILAAPTNAVAREPIRVSIYNRDTANVTVTVKTDDGTTERIERSVLLATGETLAFERGRGWYVTTASGAIKEGSGISGPTSATDNAVARWDGTTGTVTQNSAFLVDDSGHVTSFGGQLTFPAVQVPSAGANTLDDYEEGAFTPGVSFGGGTTGITYTTQVGNYTKIGREVMFSCTLALSSKGSSTGSAALTGLPFTSTNTASYRAACSIWGTNMAAGVTTALEALVLDNATTVSLYSFAAGASTGLDDTSFANNTNLIISGHYRV